MLETKSKSVAPYEQMKLQLERDGHGPSEGGKGGFSAGPRERNIYDVRDYKIADLEKGASTLFVKKWKHVLELFVDTIGPSWSGVTSLLRHCRLYEDGAPSTPIIRSRTNGWSTSASVTHTCTPLGRSREL